MMLKLEQVFFGRGSDGYGILGVSPGVHPLAARVEALCGGVGTPDVTYNGEPFLVSQPIGDRVALLCGRRGAPDSVGRETLFFHALVATKKDLLAAKADAFSLFAQGAFATKMPTGETEALRIDAKSGEDGSTSRPEGGRTEAASLPCVIRSDRPAHDAVRAFVGARSLDLSWTTFSFQALSGFDVQVLPHRASIPARFTEYDDSGKLIRAASPHPVATPSESEMMTFESRKRTAEQHPTQADSKHSAMLRLSLVVNVVLAAVCVLLFVFRKPGTEKPLPPPQPAVLADQKHLLDELRSETNRLVVALQEARQKIETLEALPPPGFSEADRNKLAETARKEILDTVPVNEIIICLNSLVGKNNEKSRINEWLNTIQTADEKTKQ